MKLALPWFVALALLGVAAFFFSANRKLSNEAAALREGAAKLEPMRAELEAIKTSGSSAQADEITKLRKDNQDLLRLRNEVRQSRDEKKQLVQQTQAAQAEVQRAQAQVQEAQGQVRFLATNAPPQLTPEQVRFAARYGRDTQTVANGCINNLRQIDGAKQQWALENKKNVNDTPTEQEIVEFFKDVVMPKCPGGGVYKINSVQGSPTCSIAGHALPE